MAEDYVAKTQRAYASSPGKYIDATGSLVPIDELKRFITMLPARKYPVLDAGCAAGRDTQVMVDTGLKARGIDLSDELLSSAKKIHPDLDFKKMDIRSLKYPDNHFGGIWSNAVLHHLNDNDLYVALNEMLRVLVPGGVLCISLKEGKGSRWVDESFSSDLSRFYNFKYADELKDLLQGLGFFVNSSYTRNEREMFGPSYRDLNWVWMFATKPVRYP